MDVFGDGAFEGGERIADLDAGGWLVGVQEWAQEPVLKLGVEHGDADALAGELVGVAAREALDETVQPQPAEVLAHLALVVGLAEMLGDEPAQALVGEAGDGMQHIAEGAGQSHGA